MSIVSSVSAGQLDIPTDEVAAGAAETDRAGRYPAESIEALRSAGLLGLGVGESHGGPGGGAVTIARALEQVAGACGSTGMIYTMHLVAVQTIQACAGTEGPAVEALQAIAAGEHLTTIAFSEAVVRWRSTPTSRG